MDFRSRISSVVRFLNPMPFICNICIHAWILPGRIRNFFFLVSYLLSKNLTSHKTYLKQKQISATFLSCADFGAKTIGQGKDFSFQSDKNLKSPQTYLKQISATQRVVALILAQKIRHPVGAGCLTV